MSICTYLTFEQKNARIHNVEIEATLRELNDLDNNRWVVREFTGLKGRWLFKKPYYFYSLLFDYAETEVEYQLINFYRPEGDTGFNTSVPAELIVAYLYGAIGALRANQRKAS